MPTLHVCLDESGDLNFSPTGTKYFVFAAAWTLDPRPLAHSLSDLRYSLLKQGHDLDSFHAAPDKQVNRDAVVAALIAHENWNYIGIVIEKAKTNPVLWEPKRFYPKFAAMAFRYVFKGCTAGCTRVLAFTDALPVTRHKEAVVKAFKITCKSDLPHTPFEIYHHPRQSNCWLQVADYCCWALYKKWEKGETRTYDSLRPRLHKTELDVFREGDGTVYYTKP